MSTDENDRKKDMPENVNRLLEVRSCEDYWMDGFKGNLGGRISNSECSRIRGISKIIN